MNQTHPALPGYTGPDRGLAGLVHHDDRLYEYCYSFRERIKYIRANKPAHEIATRERCLVYLNPTGQPWATALDKAQADYSKAWADLDKAWADLDKARADHDKARAAHDKAWADLDKARADFDKALQPHAAAIEAQIRALVPDLPWDGTRLVFPAGGTA